VLGDSSDRLAPFRSPLVLGALVIALGLGVVLGRSTSGPGEAPTPPLSAPGSSDGAEAPAGVVPPPAPTSTPLAEAPEPPPRPAEAHAEFRFDGTQPGYEGSSYVLGWVTNTSTIPIQRPAVTVVLVAEDGRELAVENGYASVPVLEAEASTPISIMLSQTPAHARMEFEVDARPVSDAIEVPAVRVVDPVAEPPVEGKRWSFRGRLANEGTVPLRHARVSVYGISADGKNLGMQTTYANVEVLEPGQSARFVTRCDRFTGIPSRFEYLPEANFVR
jgi:hypothetical protein